MSKILVDKQLLHDAAKLLFLLGKYRNNGIDTKIFALQLAETIDIVIKKSEATENG